jgi:hypothetical protein
LPFITAEAVERETFASLATSRIVIMIVLKSLRTLEDKAQLGGSQTMLDTFLPGVNYCQPR